MKRSTFIILLALLVVVLLGLFYIIPVGYKPKQIQFDTVAWEKADCKVVRTRIRQQMLNDLKNKISNSTKAEVVQLLGEPDKYGQYCLGPEPFFPPIDTAWLEINYNENNQVSRVDTIRIYRN